MASIEKVSNKNLDLKTDNEYIKNFESVIKFKKLYEKYPNAKWGYLGNGKFGLDSDGNGEIEVFMNETTTYLNIENFRISMKQDGIYENIFKLAGYEEKQENSINEMYEIKTGKKIEQFSKEYLESWNQILFYELYRYINYTSGKELKKRRYESNLLLFIGIDDIKSLRLKHLIEYHKKMDTYNPYIIELDIKESFPPDVIKGWITESRFEKVNDIVTKEEIEEYKKNNYIDDNLYNECIKLIENRDKLKQEKEKKQNNIKKNTQSNLIQEKSEFNV